MSRAEQNAQTDATNLAGALIVRQLSTANAASRFEFYMGHLWIIDRAW